MSAREIVRGFALAGPNPSPAAKARVLALGAETEAPILEILDDPSLAGETSRGGGWAPIHAIRLARTLGLASAVPRIIGILLARDPAEIAFDDATEALVALGPVALPSLVAARTEASSDDHKSRLEAVLARLGGKEPVILAFLLEGLARGDSAAPANLARFGDPRALEDLSAALDRAELVEREDSPLLVGHHVVELVGAIRKLGGALSEAQQRRLGSTLDQRRSIAEGLLLDAAEVRRKKTGRNEPCWCGSGKKYKKCHS